MRRHPRVRSRAPSTARNASRASAVRALLASSYVATRAMLPVSELGRALRKLAIRWEHPCEPLYPRAAHELGPRCDADAVLESYLTQ